MGTSDTVERSTYTNTLTETRSKRIEKTDRKSIPEKSNQKTEDSFVSPPVELVKEDRSIKIALDSRKLNEKTIKKHKCQTWKN